MIFMAKPIYILEKHHHWCKDTASDSVSADKYLVEDLFFIRNSRIRNVFNLLTLPYFLIKLPFSDIYIVSDFYALLLLKLKSLFTIRKFKVIHFLFSDYYSVNHSGLKKKLMMWCATIVSGAIVPGSMLEKEIRDSGFNFPIRVSYHYPKNNNFFKYSSNPSSLNILSIGLKSKVRKGEDIIFEISKKLTNNYFYILGDTKFSNPNILAKLKSSNNIILTGHVNPVDFVSKCTFYLLPGRYDAGPIALTEALASGLIPVVSNKLGGQDLVRQVRDDLVIDSLNPDDYIKKLHELMNLSHDELIKLSNKAKQVALNLTMDRGMSDFKIKFNELLSDLE